MYDVFISYRRQENNGTSNVTLARSIKLELEKRHYKVFFDYSECTDDYFSEKNHLSCTILKRAFSNLP